MEEKSNRLLNVVCVLIAVAGVVIIAYLADDMQLFPDKDSLIITFLGVLATFVVVSNFSQVANIEQKTDKKIGDMETRLNKFEDEYLDKDNDASLPSKIKAIQVELDGIKEDGKLKTPKEIEEEACKGMRDNLNEEIKQNRKAVVEEVEYRSLQMLKFANALINAPYKKIIQSLLYDLDAIFRVKYISKGKSKSNKANIRLVDGNIHFISLTGKSTFTNVQMIDDVVYDPAEMDIVMQYVISALTKTASYMGKDNIPQKGKEMEDDQL